MVVNNKITLNYLIYMNPVLKIDLINKNTHANI